MYSYRILIWVIPFLLFIEGIPAKNLTNQEDIVVRPLFVVPVNFTSPWKTISVTELKCPPITPLVKGQFDHVRSFSYERQLTHHELDPVKGYLCHSLQYTTQCSESFFGGQTITKKIENIQLTPSDCKLAIDSFQKGDLLEPYFPPQSCIWMGYDVVKIKFIIVNEHYVSFDPYNKEFTDGLFTGTVCKESICKTVHENTIWFTHSKIKDECSVFQMVNGLIYSSLGRDKLIKYREYGYASLEGSCRMNYCGKEGLRLKNGIFIGGAHVIDVHQPCPPNLQINIEPELTKMSELETDLIDVTHRVECLNTIQKVRITNTTTFLDLSNFQPKYVGRHRVYRLKDNNLQTSVAYYEELKEFSLGSNGKIGILGKNINYHYKDWVPSGGKFSLLSGFNGVHAHLNLTIIVPNIDLFKMEYSETLLIKHSLLPVRHPKVEQYEKEGLSDTITELVSHNSVDVGGWFSRVWNAIWGKIGMIIFIIIGSFLLVKIIGCIIRARRERKRKEKENKRLRGSEVTSPSTSRTSFVSRLSSRSNTKSPRAHYNPQALQGGSVDLEW